MTRSYLLLPLALGAVIAVNAASSAQTPSEAQQQAIRSNCVSDYRTHCASVPTGGMAALACLEHNVEDLSPACKAAVVAVDPDATKASAPGAAPAASSTSTAPSSATQSPAAAPAASSASSSTATTAPTAAAPASTAAAPNPPTRPALTSATPPGSMPTVSFRRELALAGGACATDFRLLCPNLPVGHGNAIFCLRVHADRLAPACRAALVAAGVGL